jgi:hypothetical protein
MEETDTMVQRLIRLAVSLTVIATCALSLLTVLAEELGGTASASAATQVESCHGNQLVGVFVRTGVWTGNLDTLIFVSNVSDSTCRLGGYPTLFGVRDGHRYRLHVTSHQVLSNDLAPTTLKPRMSGALIIGTGDACSVLNQTGHAAVAAAHTYTGLVLMLPDNGGVITVLGMKLDTACYLSETQLGWRTPFPMMLP